MHLPTRKEAVAPPALQAVIARSRTRYKRTRATDSLARRHRVSAPDPDQPQLSRAEVSTKCSEEETSARIELMASIQGSHMDGSRGSIKHGASEICDTPQRKSLKELPIRGHAIRARADFSPSDTGDTVSCFSQNPILQAQCVSQPQRGRLRYRQEKSQSTPKRSLALEKQHSSEHLVGHTNGNRPKKRQDLNRTMSETTNAAPTKSIVTPPFDAPISAVNAGARRVVVKYRQYTISLPVTLTTTPLDIISLMSEQAQDLISPELLIVIESYRQLGLERPLRRFERIRDILNSWDHDTQNTLSIIPSPTGGRDEDLDFTIVSKIEPRDVSVSMYHSQKPGLWVKRWVTLRADGQILIAKKEGGEMSSICHLSDFDVYNPTARQLSKKIRPPRKHCFTVKSQQRSSMFMSTINFVHFFSTKDETLAIFWYKTLQGWRSWYLVNVMGEGQNNPQSSRPLGSNGTSPDSHPKLENYGGSSIQDTSRKVETAGASGCHGIPLHCRDKSPVQHSEQPTENAQTAGHMIRKDSTGKVSMLIRVHSERKPFAATGLLGRTYTQRQTAQQLLDTVPTAVSNPVHTKPFTDSQPGGLKQASSQRSKTRPLIDLTPQYRELPQHSRKGRGVIPEQIPAGGLVEIATSPENTIEVPPAVTWQKPTTRGRSTGPGPELQHYRMTNRDCSGGPSKLEQQHSTSPGRGGSPFTGGLLATNRYHDITGTGGVMTGNRQAKVPMLDVDKSKYTLDRLCNRVEGHDGGPRFDILTSKWLGTTAFVEKGS